MKWFSKWFYKWFLFQPSYWKNIYRYMVKTKLNKNLHKYRMNWYKSGPIRPKQTTNKISFH